MHGTQLPTGYKERFHHFDVLRRESLERKREHSMLTIPSLLPFEGRAVNSALDVPYNSLAAEGINNLASRIMSVVFPLNGQSVFEVLLEQPFKPEGKDDTELDATFSDFEESVMDTLAPTNMRSAINLAYRHLIAIGDVMLHMDDNLNFRLYRADQYVVRRRHEGSWEEIIIREQVNADWHPTLQAIPKPADTSGAGTGIADNTQEQWEPLFTQIVRAKNGVTTVEQEFRGAKVPGTKETHKVCPYMPARWSSLIGEAYGVSLVEDMFGDIRTLDSLSKALLDGVMLNAEHRWILNPGGMLELQDFLDSINGDTLCGGNNDLTPMQFQNNAQVVAAQQAVAHREAILGRRFLMNSAVQPKGERVTARQVTLLAQELEQALGGILSLASAELQEPIIRRTMFIMSQRGLLDKRISEQIEKNGGFLKLRLRAGLEILNREAEKENLERAISIMAQMNPEMLRGAKMHIIGRDWWQAQGLDAKGRWKTDQEMEQEMQLQMQQAQQQQMLQAGLQAGVAQASQQGDES